MSNVEQIQKMAQVVQEFAKTAESPFQTPGEFHAKFFSYMYDNDEQSITDGAKIFIVALRDVMFEHIDKGRIFDPEDFNSKYDAMSSDWIALMMEVLKLLPKDNDILDSMFYPAMLPEFFERTLAYCGLQYLVGQ